MMLIFPLWFLRFLLSKTCHFRLPVWIRFTQRLSFLIYRNELFSFSFSNLLGLIENCLSWLLTCECAHLRYLPFSSPPLLSDSLIDWNAFQLLTCRLWWVFRYRHPYLPQAFCSSAFRFLPQSRRFFSFSFAFFNQRQSTQHFSSASPHVSRVFSVGKLKRMR